MSQHHFDAVRRAAAGQGSATGHEQTAVPAPGLADHKPAKLLKFSTDGIPATNRVQLWEHHNSKALIPLDIRTMDDAPLQASEVNLHFPSLKFAQVKGSAQVVERNERFIRQNPMDAIAVFFALEGEAFFYYGDGQESLKPGQAVIYDADRPFLRGFCKGLRELVLTIPRDDYLELSGGKPLLKPQVFNFNQGEAANRHMLALAKLVSGTIAGQAQTSQPANLEGAEDSALELLSLMIIGERSGTGAGYLATARSYIEDRLVDPQLSAAEVAAAVGISERHLTRIFAEAGEPPSLYVLGLRLELARTILSDPTQRTTPVGRISARAGFASQSYFTRAFKARFGLTPLQLRKDALLSVAP
ncbi:AraC family transcriptional regulator [Arthrobacter sp. VKM Ac-2550]|uniref:AraC family transcriptional regulator n=1 Tax=Crystallibacter permensis TaxID=1938888 RepID=UPI0022279E0A|nr:AraC family transcriptional regulator [Arthrobacter sp. VKM Ac-2550]MCW2134074.1 transcriptional regulator, AraC family [Arthrobacter sp. VKM Ac-2550]